MARKRPRSETTDETPMEVGLEHSRWRHFAWALVGLVAGLLFIFAIGGPGPIFGVLFLTGGVSAAWSFVRTLRHPPGSIVLQDDGLSLPSRLCSGETVFVPLDELRHAYLVRHAVGWTTSGPILVVETNRATYQYPRDWFSADSDQRRIVRAVNRRLQRI